MSQFVKCVKGDYISTDPDLEKIKRDHGGKLTIFNFFQHSLFKMKKFEWENCLGRKGL
jgi:hypothetical protein